MLLTSSERAKTYRAPVRVSSGIVTLDPAYFAEGNTPNVPFAVLLEGSFRSHFEQTLSARLREDPDFAFRSKSAQTAMVVVSDGDLAKNKFLADGRILPLGYDRYARRVVYDNKEFLLNAINYLLEENALISVRSRSILPGRWTKTASCKSARAGSLWRSACHCCSCFWWQAQC